MSSLHGDFVLQRSMPAPALESAQAALQGVQVQMTRQGGTEKAELVGWVKGGGYTVASGSSASNEGLRGATSAVGPRSNRESHDDVRQTAFLWESGSRKWKVEERSSR